eukprot:CAMPEP_0194081488 /NCGR_PEP_ID=MMETSP0149-20130528/7260_1 /TAXON_ID=122233 /ORGANISM="Chaetoceros debilis, Strain MM31A-1" /LENGTH=469 /DNA_ID=CAMNT_0038763421 /DNA_START=50 /DNA_END=1459 /DNA_ORIENTATION=+
MKIDSRSISIIQFMILMNYGCALSIVEAIPNMPNVEHKFYVDPCTGSISNDSSSRDEEDLPCTLGDPDQENISRPEEKLTIMPTELSQENLIQCPSESDCDIETFKEIATVIKYYYAVETNDSITDPSAFLPTIQRNLLTKLAGEMLSYCINPTRKYLRRHLSSNSMNDVTGLCSEPDDVYLPEESCIPEKGQECFVIEGAISVAIEGDPEGVIEAVLDIAENAMKNDELSESIEDVVKVTFIGPDTHDFNKNENSEIGNTGGGIVGGGDSGNGSDGVDNNGGGIVGGGENVGAGPQDGSGNEQDKGTYVGIDTDTNGSEEDNIPEGLIVGTSFAAVASLLALFLIKKKRDFEEKVEDESPFGMQDFPGVANNKSYVSADGQDLAKVGTCMDVHQCKSQTCTKCYRGRPIQFLGAPLNANGEFAQTNVDAVPTRTYSDDVDNENDDAASNHGSESSSSWTATFPRLQWW